MKTFFSVRHRDALDAKKLEVSFTRPLRTGMERILDRFSDGDAQWGRNWSYETAHDTLTTFYGRCPRAYSEDDLLEEASFPDVTRAGFPPHVVDAIEAWFDAKPPQAREAEAELNDLLAIHRSDWRFVNGMAMRIDSEYLHEEVVATTLQLLAEVGAAGAQEEFEAAVAALQSRDTKRAVTEAHKSVESAMKTVLGISHHATFGGLLAQLLRSGLVPEYYTEFLQHFEKIVLGAGKERNQPGTGHGQGAQPREVSPALAQFAVHLAGTINRFLIERWIEAGADQTQIAQPQLVAEDDDIPF